MMSLMLAVALSASQAGAAQPPRRAAPVQKKAPAPAATAANPEFDKTAKAAAAARDAGRIDEAIALYLKGVRLSPSWVEGHWSLGTAYYELDKYADAKDAFGRVVRLQPQNAPAFGFKGLCEFQLKAYEQALADLTRSADLGLSEPKDLVDAVMYHAAITYTRLQQYEFALQTLQSFSRQSNDSPRIIEALGMALLRIPMVPSELPADRREMVMLAGRGAHYLAIRTPAAAKNAFELLVQRYPDAPGVHYAYGVYLLEDQPDRAIEEFNTELKTTPDHVASMLQIVFEYLRRSDWETARPWAQKIVELDPGNFAGRRALGQVLLETGDTGGSIMQFETGVRIAPDSPSLHFMLARAYQKAGRPDAAERERTEFLRLDRLVRAKRQGQPALGGIDRDSIR
jgi:tetratricopeptide (TPR) repeat protein